VCVCWSAGLLLWGWPLLCAPRGACACSPLLCPRAVVCCLLLLAVEPTNMDQEYDAIVLGTGLKVRRRHSATLPRAALSSEEDRFSRTWAPSCSLPSRVRWRHPMCAHDDRNAFSVDCCPLKERRCCTLTAIPTTVRSLGEPVPVPAASAGDNGFAEHSVSDTRGRSAACIVLCPQVVNARV
jgi:hypothetical protein